MAYYYDHNVERPTEVYKTLNIRSTSAPNYGLSTTAKGETAYSYQSNSGVFAGYAEDVKYSSKRTKQLYTNNSKIDKTRQSPMRDKAHLYTQDGQVWTAKDNEVAENPEWDSPVDGSITINIPYDKVVTEDDIWAFVEDLLSKWIIEHQSMLAALVNGNTRLPEKAILG